MREEADPSGSMKIKEELDQQRKKLGIKTDLESKKWDQNFLWEPNHVFKKEVRLTR